MNLAELKEKVDAAIEQVKAEEGDPTEVPVRGNLLFDAEFSLTTPVDKNFTSRSQEIEMNDLEVQDTDFVDDVFNLNLREE